MRPSILLLTLVCLEPLRLSGAPRVEYVPAPAFEHKIASPPEIKQICKEVQAMLHLTNGYCTNQTIVAWSLKKIEGDRPPILKEEVVLYFEIVGKPTNNWIIACPTRNAGRGGLGLEAWHPSCSWGDMIWVSCQINRPDVKKLSAFLRDSNFGHNEFDSDIEPIYVEVYAPYKMLLRVVSRGISSDAKRRRFDSRNDLLIERN